MDVLGLYLRGGVWSLLHRCNAAAIEEMNPAQAVLSLSQYCDFYSVKESSLC